VCATAVQEPIPSGVAPRARQASADRGLGGGKRNEPFSSTDAFNWHQRSRSPGGAFGVFARGAGDKPVSVTFSDFIVYDVTTSRRRETPTNDVIATEDEHFPIGEEIASRTVDERCQKDSQRQMKNRKTNQRSHQKGMVNSKIVVHPQPASPAKGSPGHPAKFPERWAGIHRFSRRMAKTSSTPWQNRSTSSPRCAPGEIPTASS